MIKITSRNIIGTQIQIFEAWIPTTLKSEYASLLRIDEVLHGRIGTNRKGNYQDQFSEAYEAILLKHPKAINGIFSNGRIEMVNK